MGQGSITLESVDGLTAQGHLSTGQTITFHIRLTNNTGFNVEAWSCGHRIWSPDGAFWTDVSGTFTGAITTEMLENSLVSPTAGIDGLLADTIGFGGFKQTSPGIPTGFSEVTHSITIGPVDAASNGLTICLDSSLFGAVTTWKWATDGGEVLPNWSGPHCYLIDACPDDPNDSDNDGWGNTCDNCPSVPNPDQANGDGDQWGDACDPCTDSDDDGFGDPGYPINTCVLDNCPYTANPGQEDPDADGIGSACDNCPDDSNVDQDDMDEDGWGDLCDNCPEKFNPNQLDNNGDGIGDVCQSCCIDYTGNIDCSPIEEPDVSDLVTLVRHQFVSFEPLCCMDEANVDGSIELEPDISDLVYLVAYLFLQGPEPVLCLTGGGN